MMLLEAVCTVCGETFNPADIDDLEHLVRSSDEEPCGGPGVLLGGYGFDADDIDAEALDLYFTGDDGAAAYFAERDARLAEHSETDRVERALLRSAPTEARIGAWLAAVTTGATPAEELPAINRVDDEDDR